MADFKLSRRDFLIGGASALVAPELARAFKPGAPFHQTQKGWINMRTTGSIGARSLAQARTLGNYVFMYGGQSTSTAYQSTAAWFDATNNAWQVITPTTGTAPAGRTNFGIATNGTHVFVWGGTNGTRMNSGGLYTPSALGASGGTWVTATTTGAPSARELCTIVWCNNKYIVWGGRSGGTYYNDGGIFDPVANSWTSIPAPSSVTISGRSNHSAIATSDNRMILFGGFNGTAAQEDGFIFNPAAGTWTTMSASPFAGGGWGNSLGSVWIGTRAFLWGGGAQAGALYNPTTNVWTPISGVNSPTGASNPQVWWTGSKIIFADLQCNYGIYDPSLDAWSVVPTTNGPTTGTTLYCLAYANRRFCYWGGTVGTTRQNNGKMYYHPAYF